MASEVVARYIDGRVVKGISYDIDANKHYCIIWTTEDDSVEVHLAELKALFFVKDLVGDPRRADGATLAPNDKRAKGAFPIDVEFADGERVAGLTVRYPPVREFFYVLPVDPRSNNVRILVNRAAVVRIRQKRDAKA